MTEKSILDVEGKVISNELRGFPWDHCWEGIVTVKSPMSHNSDESMGTDTKFRRVGLLHNGKVVRIPVYSGNAFRGIFRRIAAKQFCDLIGLGVQSMSDALYYTFFCGGALQKGSAQSYIEIGKKREMREMIPFLSLLGAAVVNSIIPGKLEIGVMMPVCAETVGMTGIASDVSVWSLLDEVFYTRRDDREDKEKREKDEGAQQMKYQGEILIPGTQLKHKIAAHGCNEVELACFGYAIRAMVEKGVLGGKSGVGHGQVQCDYKPVWPEAKPYLDYIDGNKAKISEYVQGMEKAL
jgi:hypothetical protein